MYFEGESTIALKYQNNFFLYSKYLSLYLQIRVIFTPHQDNFSLNQMEIIEGNHNQSNKECEAQSQNNYNTTPTPKAQGTIVAEWFYEPEK